MATDYTFTQKLINFGRGLAGKFVGQPFVLYRLNQTSTGNVIQDSNIIDGDIRAKVTHRRVVTAMENEYLHVTTFEFLVSSDDVRIGDILAQNDPTYGDDQDTNYAVVSRRPLKPVMVARVESACTIYRPFAPGAPDLHYRGARKSEDLPYVLVNGVFAIGEKDDTPAIVPCGIQSIGQIKNRKATDLPMDNLTNWWYIFVPLLPGLTRLNENDVVLHRSHPDEEPNRYRINTAYTSPVGTAGHFLLCEKVNA